MGWLFPGKTVRIEAPCIDCGENMVIEMLDGQVLNANPAGIVGYAARGFRGPHDEWSFR